MHRFFSFEGRIDGRRGLRPIADRPQTFTGFAVLHHGA